MIFGFFLELSPLAKQIITIYKKQQIPFEFWKGLSLQELFLNVLECHSYCFVLNTLLSFFVAPPSSSELNRQVSNRHVTCEQEFVPFKCLYLENIPMFKAFQVAKTNKKMRFSRNPWDPQQVREATAQAPCPVPVSPPSQVLAPQLAPAPAKHWMLRESN